MNIVQEYANRVLDMSYHKDGGIIEDPKQRKRTTSAIIRTQPCSLDPSDPKIGIDQPVLGVAENKA